MKIIRLTKEYIESLFKISIDYIDWKEYLRRLRLMGWTVKNEGSHRTARSPVDPETGRSVVITEFSFANWEKNWQKQRQDLRQKLNAQKLDSKALDFIFESVFEIPEYFNYYTLQNEVPVVDNTSRIYFSQLAELSFEENQVYYGGEWKTIEDCDFSSYSLMFSDGSIAKFKPNEQIVMRKI